MKDTSRCEVARWKKALDFLVNHVWVKSVGYKGEVFEVTGTGYKVADMNAD